MKLKFKQHPQVPQTEPLYVLPREAQLVQVEALAMSCVGATSEYPDAVIRDPDELDTKIRAGLTLWREKQASARRPLTNDFYQFCEIYVPTYCEHYFNLIQKYDASSEAYLADKAEYDAHTPMECLQVMRLYFALQLSKENQHA